jgi:hypothetical protein
MNDELTLLSAKILANSRVDLYDKNYLFRIKWTLPMLLTVSFILLSVLFYTEIITQTQLLISGLVVIVVFLILQILSRRARVAALKGDTLILKGIDSKSTVTSIGSVRRASSFQIFGIPITHLDYILDHQRKTSFVFGAPSGFKYPVDKVIAHAKKCKKIKGKS